MVGALLAATPVMPVHALVLTGGGVCTGALDLSFTPALTRLPGAPTFSVTGTPGCTGVGGNSLTVNVPTMNSFDASCAGIAATGNGTMAFGNNFPVPVTVVMVGLTPVQVWIGIDLDGTLEAAGVFAWINAGEITACATGFTTTMTLVGAFVVVA